MSHGLLMGREKVRNMKVWKDRKQLEILFPPPTIFSCCTFGARNCFNPSIIQEPPHVFFCCSSPLFFGEEREVVWVEHREVEDFRWPLATVVSPNEAGSTVSRTPEELLTELRQVLITKAVHCLGWCHRFDPW